MFLSGLETAKLLLLKVRKLCRAFLLIGQNSLTVIKKDVVCLVLKILILNANFEFVQII